MKRVTLSPEAADELAESAAWYDSERPGLGLAFLDQVEALLTVIGERPRSFPVLVGPSEIDLRRALVPRFPFGVIVLELGEDCRVVAFAHLKRDPGYWLHRIE